MSLRIDYGGLIRADKRDRKHRKEKYGMVVDGKSTKLLFEESLKHPPKRRKKMRLDHQADAASEGEDGTQFDDLGEILPGNEE